MREAQIILPLPPGGASWDEVQENTRAHHQLKDMLLRHFNGYTSTLVSGAWRDSAGRTWPDESVAYTVAMEPTTDNEQVMRTAASWAGQAASQQCVYLRQASGEVEFVSCHRVEAKPLANVE